MERERKATRIMFLFVTADIRTIEHEVRKFGYHIMEMQNLAENQQVQPAILVVTEIVITNITPI